MSKDLSKEQINYRLRVSVNTFVEFQVTKDKGLSRDEVIESIDEVDMERSYGGVFKCESLSNYEVYRFMVDDPCYTQVTVWDKETAEWNDYTATEKVFRVNGSDSNSSV